MARKPFQFSDIAAEQARRIQEYALVGENVEAKEMLMIGRGLVGINRGTTGQEHVARKLK